MPFEAKCTHYLSPISIIALMQCFLNYMWAKWYLHRTTPPLKNPFHQPLCPVWAELKLIDLCSADGRVTRPILIYIMIGHGLAVVTFNRRKHINQQDVYLERIANRSHASPSAALPYLVGEVHLCSMLIHSVWMKRRGFCDWVALQYIQCSRSFVVLIKFT